MSYIPPAGGSPYVNHSGNPLRVKPSATVVVPQGVATPPQGVRARDVVAVVHHTAAGDVVEYNNVAAPAIQQANAPQPHGGGVYQFAKR